MAKRDCASVYGRWNICLFALLVASAAGLNSIAGAAELPVGTFTKVKDTVAMKMTGVEQEIPVTAGAECFVGNRITTGRDGAVQVAFTDGSYLDLADDSSVLVLQYLFDPVRTVRRARIKVLKGRVRVVLYKALKAGSKFLLETDQAMIKPAPVSNSVVLVTESRTTVVVLSGQAIISHAQPFIIGDVLLGTDQKTVVDGRTPPLYPSALRPTELKHYRKGFAAH